MSTKYSDILRNSSLFDTFAAKEEYDGKRDQYGRFLYEFSSNKSVQNPIVSNYLLEAGLLDLDWPENHKFAACLTHDVDIIYPSWKYTFFTTAKFASKLTRE